MKEARKRTRELFLARMSKDAMGPYESPRGEWEENEKEYLPFFLSHVGNGKQILDLAGGYAKAAPNLLQDGNSVVLADLSLPSLRRGREALASRDVQFVRLDMNTELPFVDEAFDGIWFSQAFEYVPPEKRMRFLRALRRTVKEKGIVFFSAEGLSNMSAWLSYLKGYVYWKLLRRAPIVWGECIYRLDLPDYKGWHYHSLVLSRLIEKDLRAAGFEILKSKNLGKSEYYTYVLRAV
jgi:ubiquinone/menaquinone biosynthesis C-methylase UbiE